MEILTFRTPGLGDTSYLLTHEGTGVLVDPQRDIGRFLEAAEERDVELRFVLETHLHNDYVSGAEQAALTTGAELVLPAAAAPAYRHTPAFHLEDLDGGGGLVVRPIHTPGHTPEHTSYLVLIDGEEVGVFSGGSLLVGSAGRPDLLGPERADTLGRLQYISINRLAQLPADVELFPTHGQGSFCSASGSAKFTSTIGEQVRENPMLQYGSADELATALTAAPMPIPAFYQYMSPTNTLGVPPLPTAEVPHMTAQEALDSGAHLVDLRPRAAQSRGILPGSTAVELADDFGSWVGWLVPYNEPVVLIAEPDQDVDAALTQLAQIRFDEVAGLVTDLGGVDLVQDFELVDLDRARSLVADGIQVLDVRMDSELAEVRMPGAVERFVAELFSRGVPEGLSRDEPVLIACRSGRRAAIAASRLTSEGYDVRVLDGAGVTELVGE